MACRGELVAHKINDRRYQEWLSLASMEYIHLVVVAGESVIFEENLPDTLHGSLGSYFIQKSEYL